MQKGLLFSLAMGGFAIGTTEFATMSILPYLAKGLNISTPVAGHLISAYALGVVVGAPLIAVLGARFSRRRLLLLLMSYFALTHIVASFITSYQAMWWWRFLGGLPHGAYFGIGALVAASSVSIHQRAMAVGLMMVGLTVATVVGVPIISWTVLAFGWRSVFILVACIACVTVLLLWRFLPKTQANQPNSSAKQELGALLNIRMWSILAIGAIGWGGAFAVYTYLSDTLIIVTGISPKIVPLILALFGVGMTLGNLIAPRLLGHNPMRGVAILLIWGMVAVSVYPFSLHHVGVLCVLITSIGLSGSMGTLLQIVLMDVAQDAQIMAAALNHSAFNIANALGPFLGGLALSAGYGWASTGWVALALSFGGLVLWVMAKFLLSTHTAKTVVYSQVK